MNFLNQCFSCLKALFVAIFGLAKALLTLGLSLWYVIWFTLGSIYLYYNWEKAMVFFPFNGHALIFAVWLIMIFILFIKDVNSPWLNINFNEWKKKQKNTNEAKKEFEEKLANTENTIAQTQGGGQND